MTDYAYRAKVIKSGLVDKVKNYSWLKYWSAHNNKAEFCYELQYAELFDKLDDRKAYEEAERVYASEKARNTRLKHRISFMLANYDCVFLTLTFRDDILEKTTPEKRRLYVIRYLKSQYKHYIANIDFGDRYGREHYHAIICGKVSFSNWKYGAINGKNIRKCSNPICLGKYINKLTRHAIKQTCKRNHIIYSRSSFEEREREKGIEVDTLKLQVVKILAISPSPALS